MHPVAAPTDLWDRIEQAAALLREPAAPVPQVAVVLGSGLGSFADHLHVRKRVPFAKIPHFPTAHVEGHRGEMVFADIENVPAVIMNGRVHAYEGYPMHDVTFGIRVMRALGAHSVVLTNAAGGVNPHFAPGDLMVLADHLNLTGHNPLVGPNESRLGTRFPDMTHLYTPALRQRMHMCGATQGVSLKEGVYAGLLGPSFETPSEIRYLQRIGADAVGMSTVGEAIVARHMGMRVAGLSVISNHAAGISPNPLSHAEVQEVGRMVEQKVLRLLTAFIPQAAQVAAP